MEIFPRHEAGLTADLVTGRDQPDPYLEQNHIWIRSRINERARSGIFEEITSPMHCILRVVSKFNDLGLMHVFDWVSNIFCLWLRAKVVSYSLHTGLLGKYIF
jgi:hypothetical protein